MKTFAIQERPVLMSEPNASVAVPAGIAAAAITAFGPLLAEYTLILIGGFFGALFALHANPDIRSWQRVTIFLLRAEGAAVVFSSIGSVVLSAKLGIQIDILWMPVSALIGMYVHRVHDFTLELFTGGIDIALERIRKLFGGSK